GPDDEVIAPRGQVRYRHRRGLGVASAGRQPREPRDGLKEGRTRATGGARRHVEIVLPAGGRRPCAGILHGPGDGDGLLRGGRGGARECRRGEVRWYSRDRDGHRELVVALVGLVEVVGDVRPHDQVVAAGRHAGDRGALRGRVARPRRHRGRPALGQEGRARAAGRRGGDVQLVVRAPRRRPAPLVLDRPGHRDRLLRGRRGGGGER